MYYKPVLQKKDIAYFPCNKSEKSLENFTERYPIILISHIIIVLHYDCQFQKKWAHNKHSSVGKCPEP